MPDSKEQRCFHTAHQYRCGHQQQHFMYPVITHTKECGASPSSFCDKDPAISTQPANKPCRYCTLPEHEKPTALDSLPILMAGYSLNEAIRAKAMPYRTAFVKDVNFRKEIRIILWNTYMQDKQLEGELKDNKAKVTIPYGRLHTCEDLERAIAFEEERMYGILRERAAAFTKDQAMDKEWEKIGDPGEVIDDEWVKL